MSDLRLVAYDADGGEVGGAALPAGVTASTIGSAVVVVTTPTSMHLHDRAELHEALTRALKGRGGKAPIIVSVPEGVALWRLEPAPAAATEGEGAGDATAD